MRSPMLLTASLTSMMTTLGVSRYWMTGSGTAVIVYVEITQLLPNELGMMSARCRVLADKAYSTPGGKHVMTRSRHF